MLAIIIMLVFIFGLTYLAAGKIEGGKIWKDARQNTIISYHLWKSGHFSMDGISPTYFREPLPIIFTALHIAWFTDIPKTVSSELITTSLRYTRQIAQVNIWYLMGVFLSLWWLSWRLTRSHLVGALAIIGTWLYFFGHFSNLNRPLTESPAALFFLLSSAISVWMVQTRRLGAAILTGVAMGAAALTKAAALYVGIIVIILLPMALILFEPGHRRKSCLIFLAMAFGFAVIVIPWMYRNYVNFGEFAITQRGGAVLHTRAVKNQMTSEEYAAAFYVYSPWIFRHYFFEPYLGFHKTDLEPGGRWVKLIRYQPGDRVAIQAGNVDKTISYLAKSRAIRINLIREMRAQGIPAQQADKKFQQVAINMILLDPCKHLKTTLVFAWRGLWSFAPSIKPILSISTDIVNLFSFIVFLVFPFVALWRKRIDWFAFSLFGGGLFWFYAFLTHFIPRYSEPLIPLVVLSVLVLFRSLIIRWKKRRCLS